MNLLFQGTSSSSLLHLLPLLLLVFLYPYSHLNFLTCIRFPSNKREVWIVTDGEYSDPSSTSLSAQRLRREVCIRSPYLFHFNVNSFSFLLIAIQKQATIYAIGVGSGVSMISLEKVAAAGCSFLVNNFENALNLVKQSILYLSFQFYIFSSFVSALTLLLNSRCRAYYS